MHFLVCIGINYKSLCVEFRTKVDKSIYQKMNILNILTIRCYPVTTFENSRMGTSNIFTNQCYAVTMCTCSENHSSEPCSAQSLGMMPGESGFSDSLANSGTHSSVSSNGTCSLYPKVMQCQHKGEAWWNSVIA